MTTTDAGPTTETHYSLDNTWEHARQRLGLIEATYDAGSIRRLAALGVGPGWRCLEVGGGGGSITRWLCSRVGRTGRVVAADIETRFLDEIGADNLEVARLDVTTADLPREAFDLIHARAVLAHLPSREAVLGALVASLRPGGWLLLEEPDEYGNTVLGTGTHGEAFTRINLAMRRAGFDPEWARTLPERFVANGLRDIGVNSELTLAEGGSPEAELIRLTSVQLRPLTLEVGATPELLDEWDGQLRTPGRWFPCFALVSVWGRRAG
jgi:SAM-dependent methyltransferase